MSMNEASMASQLAAALRDGLENLDLGQEVTFQGYTRTVLPLDGFVFWLPSVAIKVKGSLHYSQEIVQDEDQILGLATVVFSAEQQVAHFRQAPINTIYVANCGNFRFAFSQQQGLFDAAKIWHYFGHSINPAMASQLLDPPRTIDPTQAVTNNSLALWIAMNDYQSPFADGFSNSLPLYPSFLTPPNLVPPYGVIHIGDNDTDTVQSAPYLDTNRSSYQNAVDNVRVTIYGLQQNAAIDFMNFVEQYSLFTGYLGIMNMPVPRDAIRVQTELEARGMKKIIDFKVNYWQSRVAEVARQYILKCVPAIYIQTQGVAWTADSTTVTADSDITVDNSGTGPSYILAQAAD